MSKKIIIETNELPCFKEIRAIWISNIHHCNDENHSFFKKSLIFSPEWDKDFLGFLHFYIWCIDNGYQAGVSQLDRINKNEGFSKSNCRIIKKPKKKSTVKKAKPKPNSKLISNAPNESILTSNDAAQKIVEFLVSIGIRIQ